MSGTAFIHVRGSFVLVLAALYGCGGESSNAESGSGGSGGAGAGATSGSGGSLDGGGGSGGASTGGSTTGGAGTGGATTGGSQTGGTTTSGAGGPPPTALCPETIPVPEAECRQQNGPSCFYGDCEDGQRTVATCLASGWTLETRPCAAFPCTGSQECMPGQICSVIQGGALFGTCIANPCGAGPVTCECADAGCPACRVDDSSGGITVTCNTCPGGGCP
ncbi:hypothetical protein [Sorangium sp. So ce117]|uniref:hypothetical protein n=1 Tax=Sorangium sp. So ce117 TaxID=3133277 RepID=UPI003F60D1CD